MLESVRCNLCGADEPAPVAEIDGFQIVRCQQCSLVYVNPRYRPELLQEIYRREYYDHEGINNGLEFFGYDDYLADEENIKLTFAKRLRTIEGYVPRGRLLDIGCAMGFFLDLARSKGWDVIGSEVSEYSIEYARSQLNLDVRHGPLRSLALESGAFDVATMWDVIEHVPDPRAELAEISRILRPGGLLSIITPNVDSLVARLLGQRWEEFRRVREHIYFFSQRTLCRMLDEVGFKVERVESADKVFYLGPAMHRLKYYTWDGIITQTATRLVYKLGLDKVRIDINPMTKIAVYARKVA